MIYKEILRRDENTLRKMLLYSFLIFCCSAIFVTVGSRKTFLPEVAGPLHPDTPSWVYTLLNYFSANDVFRGHHPTRDLQQGLWRSKHAHPFDQQPQENTDLYAGDDSFIDGGPLFRRAYAVVPSGSYPSGSTYLKNRLPPSYLEGHSSFLDLVDEEVQQRREIYPYAQGAYFTGHPQDALSERHYTKRKPQGFVYVGLPGPNGQDGRPGPPGPAGSSGPPGPPGITGPSGAKGDTGATGQTGSSGAKGDIGASGSPGKDGDNGDKGDTGATGPNGPIGPAGAKGDTGATGLTGSIGQKGDDGAIGPSGQKGEKGDDGAIGAIGPDGPKGSDGAIGPGGPKGDKGSDGALGPLGPAGQKGDDGALGPQGPAGTNGIDGLKGAKGDVGPPGPTGPTGPASTPGNSG